MAASETVDNIITIAAEITGRDIADVIRSSKWGEYNFDDCRDDLEPAYTVIRAIQELPVESLLEPNADSIKVHLVNFRDAINRVLRFTVKQDVPEQKRDELAKDLESVRKVHEGTQ